MRLISPVHDKIFLVRFLHFPHSMGLSSSNRDRHDSSIFGDNKQVIKIIFVEMFPPVHSSPSCVREGLLSIYFPVPCLHFFICFFTHWLLQTIDLRTVT